MLGFHVAAVNRDVFIHQYSSVFGKADLSNRIGKKQPINGGCLRFEFDAVMVAITVVHCAHS